MLVFREPMKAAFNLTWPGNPPFLQLRQVRRGLVRLDGRAQLEGLGPEGGDEGGGVVGAHGVLHPLEGDQEVHLGVDRGNFKLL